MPVVTFFGPHVIKQCMYRYKLTIFSLVEPRTIIGLARCAPSPNKPTRLNRGKYTGRVCTGT